MTSHHESGTEELASQERIEQLKLCFKHMINAPSHRVVLFGGDLNIREKEVNKQLKGLSRKLIFFSFKKLVIFHQVFLIFGLKQVNVKNVHIHGI
jgi:hypothetical protein